MNQYTCIGRLGADPRLRGQDGPKPSCRFRLAVAPIKRDAGDQAPMWFTVTVFGRQALACGRFLRQGKQVAVSGRLEPDRWTGQDGTVHEHVQVIAHTVEFLFAGPHGVDTPEPDTPPDGNHQRAAASAARAA